MGRLHVWRRRQKTSTINGGGSSKREYGGEITIDTSIQIGIQVLPKPILAHIHRCIKDRPNIPHVYHVTDLLYCLHKEYYKRKNPGQNNFTDESAFNIYRGQTFDKLWSILFDVNQETYTIQRDGVTVSGTFDFLYDDLGEEYLYDLKMPASVFYRKQKGAGKFYKQQVQAYLAIVHANGMHLHIKKARVLMIAEDFVADQVEGDDDAILKYLWKRAFILDGALNKESPKTLPFVDKSDPEEGWQCNPEYCGFASECEKVKT